MMKKNIFLTTLFCFCSFLAFSQRKTLKEIQKETTNIKLYAYKYNPYMGRGVIVNGFYEATNIFEIIEITKEQRKEIFTFLGKKTNLKKLQSDTLKRIINGIYQPFKEEYKPRNAIVFYKNNEAFAFLEISFTSKKVKTSFFLPYKFTEKKIEETKIILQKMGITKGFEVSDDTIPFKK